MSVLLIPVHVTKTLIAPTVTVLTAVLVNKDSLEMEQFVKVLYKTKRLATTATVTSDNTGLISGKLGVLVTYYTFLLCVVVPFIALKRLLYGTLVYIFMQLVYDLPKLRNLFSFLSH